MVSHNGTRNDEEVFTVELGTMECLRRVTLDKDGKVFIEGSLGKIIDARFLDGIVLEVIGDKGTLRMDLTKEELENSRTDEKR